MSTAIHSLIQTNVAWLRQSLDLIGRLDDRIYASAPAGYAPHHAGGHLRHILEFYECLLDGLASRGQVDYDARKRDESIERSIKAASERIHLTIARLEAIPTVDCQLLVCPEDSAAGCPLLPSSLSRELMSLSSHTIHHFALIGMTLRAHGVAVDPRFGMAPSTLRHRERREAA
ncbi:MAG: hypothetical protein K2X03_04150 [Bryobacteraceae bacterium]|nr:hypothetical protein [Bryobacteraceae bacterium]